MTYTQPNRWTLQNRSSPAAALCTEEALCTEKALCSEETGPHIGYLSQAVFVATPVLLCNSCVLSAKVHSTQTRLGRQTLHWACRAHFLCCPPEKESGLGVPATEHAHRPKSQP